MNNFNKIFKNQLPQTKHDDDFQSKSKLVLLQTQMANVIELAIIRQDLLN